MTDWRPGASTELLAARAAMLRSIREFFAIRDVLEVETPLLCSTAVTDPGLLPIESGGRLLQTSPEYAMKRLLAAGSGPIYQVCKAFRAGEAGRLHNPEFSLLEWYRPGWDYRQLLEEVAELVGGLLGLSGWQVMSYREVFMDTLELDPFTASTPTLASAARDRVEVNFDDHDQLDRDGWLDLLVTHCIEPVLPEGLVFIIDYPASQAALARLAQRDGCEVAERFELYVNGVEIANGYSELVDHQEQTERFEAERQRLAAGGLLDRLPDEKLLAALAEGLPACAGVALGLDRLLMLREGAGKIDEVLSFSWKRS